MFVRFVTDGLTGLLPGIGSIPPVPDLIDDVARPLLDEILGVVTAAIEKIRQYPEGPTRIRVDYVVEGEEEETTDADPEPDGVLRGHRYLVCPRPADLESVREPGGPCRRGHRPTRPRLG